MTARKYKDSEFRDGKRERGSALVTVAVPRLLPTLPADIIAPAKRRPAGEGECARATSHEHNDVWQPNAD